MAAPQSQHSHRPCGDGSEPALSEVEGTRPSRATLGQVFLIGATSRNPAEHCSAASYATAVPLPPSRWQSNPRSERNPDTSLDLCPLWRTLNESLHARPVHASKS